MDQRYIYEFDILNKIVVNDCDLCPTEVSVDDSPWLYAANDKYNRAADVDSEKIGKWMLFVSKNSVNEMWNHVKNAVASGDLWSTKVSTNKNDDTHVIIIYTKDYTDVVDVIRVLDYLESSGLKSSNSRPIYYKTDQQTRAGIYRGGPQKSWIYSSQTIRQETSKENWRTTRQTTIKECWRTSRPETVKENWRKSKDL